MITHYNYRLESTDFEGQTSSSDIIIIRKNHSEEMHNSFQLSPIPATNLLNVDLKYKNKQDLIISIYDIDGQLQKTISLEKNSQNLNIDISKFASGMYFLKMDNGNSKTFIVK